jgi:hypothetical protein
VLLTKRQGNELFERISAKGLVPEEFQLQDNGRQADLHHRASHSVFNIWRPNRENLDRYNVKMIVGDADWRFRDSVDWTVALEGLGPWLTEVEYEASTPDLWAELQRVPEILAAAQSDDASNAPFTADEQAEISARIDQVKGVVRRENPELTAGQLAAIEQGLDEVKKASTRVGRKDWVVMVNGTLLGLVANGLVPAHVVQAVFNVLITAIGHIFGIGGPPPMIST